MGLFFIFTLILRVILISQKNLWFDEIYSWHLSQQSFVSIIFTTWSDIHPPLFYFILKFWVWIFGESPFSLRILPALCSSLSVFFIYPIARKILSERNSFIVLILFALSPLNLFYSQEVRMSALNLLFNLASTYYLIRMIEAPPFLPKGEGLKSNIINFKKYYIIFSALALYTHYFSIFVLLAQGIYIIYEKKKINLDIKIFLKSYLIIFLVFVIWIPVMVIQISRGQPWRYEQNIGDVLYQIKSFVIDIGLGFYQRYSNSQSINNVFLILISLIILAVIGCVWNRITDESKNLHERKLNNNFLLIILVFLIPLFFAICVSFKQWIEFFRYLSIIIPFFLILLVYGFSSFKLPLRLIFVMIFILINIYGLDLYYSNDSKNNDYRPIMEMINKSNESNYKVFVYPFYYGWILDYYEKTGEYPKIKNVDYGWEFNSIIDSIKKENIKNFWFVLDYHSFDSATYDEKVNSLNNFAKKRFDTTFLVKPQKIEVQEYRKLPE